MQIGTLPIIGLVAPCVFAGAFQLKAGVNVLYSSLSTVALGVASAAIFGPCCNVFRGQNCQFQAGRTRAGS